MNKRIIFLLTNIIFLGFTIENAFSCLSCGCTGSSSISDMDSISNNVGTFSRGNDFLFQFGTSFRDINGSFNERGTWFEKPSNSRIQSLSNNLKLTYFPNYTWTFSVQTSIVSNFLEKASWGDFGSISPTDENLLLGTALGDFSIQTTYKLGELGNFSFNPWLNLTFPTGNAEGKSEYISGNGTYSTSLGFLVLSKFDKFEFINNISYQIPIYKKNTNLTYSLNNSFFIQSAMNYDIFYNLKASFGIYFTSGFWGNDNKNPVFNLKVSPSIQYNLDNEKGFKLSFIYAPSFFGKNSLTDTSINLGYFNFI
ncbi:MAG: hypothetical protein U0457_11455 [Candidatus Sericytochromatia bacterium]